LCSLIDTIGSVFCKTNTEITIDGNVHNKIEKASDHFYILNHDKLFNLDLKMSTIQDFYTTYRSKLTHNNSLPANNFLSNNCSSEDIFELDSECKITKINLRPLYNKTKESIDTLIYYLRNGRFSPDHKLTNDLKTQAKPYDSSVNVRPSDTGCTISNKWS
jgi:hypothetical protein